MDFDVVYFVPIGGIIAVVLFFIVICVIGLVNVFSAVAEFGESLKEYSNIIEVFANKHTDIVLLVCLIISVLVGICAALYTQLNPNEPPGKLRRKKNSWGVRCIEAIARLIFTTSPIFCCFSLAYGWLISWVDKIVHIVIESLANPWIIIITIFIVFFMIWLAILGVMAVFLPMFLLVFGVLYDDIEDEIMYFIGRYIYPYIIGAALSAGYLYLIFNHSQLLTYLSNCM